MDKNQISLDTTLGELLQNASHWLLFVKHVADKLYENKYRLPSWKDVASHYEYMHSEINNFSTINDNRERSTILLFEKLCQREEVPTIAALKGHLREIGRHDIVRDIDEWLITKP